ncbi:MAG: hypothetical protein OEY49_05900 [Candidatus Heimdallarchaeota archaeon]|nr:hypothetical protein [Candidatus Heimdallarchaeota archaeon]
MSLSNQLFQNKSQRPNVLIANTTGMGIFSFQKIEAILNIPLEPLEYMSLQLMNEMGNITRIELHIISGMDLDRCNQVLNELFDDGLAELKEYDKEGLDANLQRVSKLLDDDWKTPVISRLMSRKQMKQYGITPKGSACLSNREKSITSTTDIDYIFTAVPFMVFYSPVNIKFNGYEKIILNSELISSILTLSSSKHKKKGVRPLAVNPDTIYDGKEVVGGHFWIGLCGDSKISINKLSNRIYLSSSSFDKVIEPDWNDEILNYLPAQSSSRDIVIRSISETFSMVEDVIDEGLTLNENGIWVLKADLEMLLLLSEKVVNPISEYQSELVMNYPNYNWQVYINMELHSYDELSEQALLAGRFYHRVSRRGFTYNEGFDIWKGIMRDFNRRTKAEDYEANLTLLLKYKCLIERSSNIESLVIDVEDVVSYNRRDSQQWSFNSIRILENYLNKIKLERIFYVITPRFLEKIDEEDESTYWIESKGIIMSEWDQGENHPAIEEALKSKSHLLTNRLLPKKSEFKSYRLGGKRLKFDIDNHHFVISGMENFYDLRINNLFQAMYNEYYE